jgi:hypothetical protein
MDKPSLPVRAALNRTVGLLGQNALLAGIAFVVMTGLAAVSEMLPPAGTVGINFGAAIASIVLQAAVTRGVMNQIGLIGSETTKLYFGSVFAIGLVSSIATLFGFLALIIPGFYIATRYAIAVPALFAKPDGFSMTLRKSWEMTKGYSIPIFAIFFIIYVPFLLELAWIGWTELAESAIVGGFGMSLVLNALISISQITGWVAAIAIFERIGGKSNSLSEIFS